MALSPSIFAYEDPTKYKDIDPTFIQLTIKDPKQKVGYTVGDKILREIKFTVKNLTNLWKNLYLLKVMKKGIAAKN